MPSVIIPAYNEARTVSQVVSAALGVGVDEVLVVDDGSVDDTAAQAAAAGAQVIRLPRNCGKGAAWQAGATAAKSGDLVLLDADLVGLSAEHIGRLLQPLRSGEAEMAIGLFAGNRQFVNLAQRVAPNLSGQRAVRRELLLQVPGLGTSGYACDRLLSDHCRRLGVPVRHVRLPALSQVVKEEKQPLVSAVGHRLRMYWEIYAGRGQG